MDTADRPHGGQVPDADLARAVAAGDLDALGGIYDRYADRLHDYCYSVLRSRDEAADAVQDVFITAARRLGQLRDPDKLRAWLYAVARHEALRRISQRRRENPTEEVPEVATADPTPEDAARKSELATLVWDAAAGLAERDRAVLDLHVRQGLDGQELADALGVNLSHSYVLLTRLRDSVERSLGALLVARQGNLDCEDLQQVLAGWDGRFTPLMRKRVARHVDNCDVCAERRRLIASPVALLGAAPLVPAPALLREHVLGNARKAASSKTALAGRTERWRDDGFPPGLEVRRRTRWVPPLPYVAASAVVLAILAAVLAVTLSSGADVSPAAVTTASASPTTVVAAGSTSVSASPAPSATPLSSAAAATATKPPSPLATPAPPPAPLGGSAGPAPLPHSGVTAGPPAGSPSPSPPIPGCKLRAAVPTKCISPSPSP